MKRREFIVGLAGAAAWPVAAWGQQGDRAVLNGILRMQAESTAANVRQFIREIEIQVGETMQLPWSAGTTVLVQRRNDGVRLLRRVPAIAELAQLDSAGIEQLRLSRLAMDVIGSRTDFSHDPKFTEAVARNVYYGPVYFRESGAVNAGVSEPYMALSLAGARSDVGVSVVEVDLKHLSHVVSQTKVGERGQAYVIDAQGRLIAHPDVNLVLRRTDMTGFAQVKAARSAGSDPSVESARHRLRAGGTARLAGVRGAADRRGQRVGAMRCKACHAPAGH